MAPTLAAWTGARIQRLDSPRPGLLSLELYSKGQRATLLLRFDSRGGAGLLAARPRGDAASGLAQKLRKHLVGSRLVRAEWQSSANRAGPGALYLELQAARKYGLTAVFDPRAPNLWCTDDADRVIIAADPSALKKAGSRLGGPPPEFGRDSPAPFEDLAEPWQKAGALLFAEHATDADTSGRSELRKSIVRLRRKAQRRCDAIAGDLARADSNALLRTEAEALMAHATAVPTGASSTDLPDHTRSDGSTLRIELDPARSAIQNAEKRFNQARRLKRGQPIARERLSSAEAALQGLLALEKRLDDPDASLGDLENEARLSLEGSGQRPRVKGEAKRTGQSPRKAYRTFLGAGRRPILVGRGASDNDTLTLRIAKPTDHWLHARGTSGAHVVVPLDRGESCPPELLVDAALLAAHFSSAKGDDSAEITHVPRRYVRKGRGSPPGTVQVERERVLHLRLTPDRLHALLAAERREP